jgi:hypothetical protein
MIKGVVTLVGDCGRLAAAPMRVFAVIVAAQLNGFDVLGGDGD